MTQNPNESPGAPEGGAPPPPPPAGSTPPPTEGPAGPPTPGGPALLGPENDEARTMAMLCHLLAIFTYWIAPLIIWLIKKEQSRYVDQQGKEVLNFELTLMIGVVAGLLTACLGVGAVILAAVQVVNIVFGILSTIEVNKGRPYRYPVCIRFVK